jgi:hypothetical protein
MGITEKSTKVGICDACGKMVIENADGVVPGYIGEVEILLTHKVVEFFACTIPHIGKAVTKLLREVADSKKGVYAEDEAVNDAEKEESESH